jgi:hypothetical protein
MTIDYYDTKLVMPDAICICTYISLHLLDYTVRRLSLQDHSYTAHSPLHSQFSSDSLYTGHSSSQSHSVYKSTVPLCDHMALLLNPYPVCCRYILGKTIKLCQSLILSLPQVTKTVKLTEHLIIDFVCSDTFQKIILKSKCITFW